MFVPVIDIVVWMVRVIASQLSTEPMLVASVNARSKPHLSSYGLSKVYKFKCLSEKSTVALECIGPC